MELSSRPSLENLYLAALGSPLERESSVLMNLTCTFIIWVDILNKHTGISHNTEATQYITCTVQYTLS